MVQKVSQPAAVDHEEESVAVDQQDNEPPPFKTLRLTLAMRGGVSLAVGSAGWSQNWTCSGGRAQSL